MDNINDYTKELAAAKALISKRNEIIPNGTVVPDPTTNETVLVTGHHSDNKYAIITRNLKREMRDLTNSRYSTNVVNTNFTIQLESRQELYISNRVVFFPFLRIQFHRSDIDDVRNKIESLIRGTTVKNGVFSLNHANNHTFHIGCSGGVTFTIDELNTIIHIMNTLK